MHPNCVLAPGGPSFDTNAWIAERALPPREIWRHVAGGLYQPPRGHHCLYLSDLRYRERVALDSVGGTMLLVDANLHRAGLMFPATPDRGLIATEAFAARARAGGIVPVGLPNLEIVHGPFSRLLPPPGALTRPVCGLRSDRRSRPSAARVGTAC